MPKSVEIIHGDPQGVIIPFLGINLMNKEPFPIDEFDVLAQNTFPDFDFGLKYVACGDQSAGMYMFNISLDHIRAVELLRRIGKGGTLQSAGFVYLSYSSVSDIPHCRTLGEYSSSLLEQLGREQSKLYRETVIRERLGDYFKYKN